MLSLLTNAHVYAPHNLGMKHVLIAGDKIVYLGDDLPTLDPVLTVQTTDLNGARLIPGFIDGHAHVTGGGGEAGFETAVPAPHLSEFVSAGVTTVVGLLGTDDLVRSTSALVARLKALKTEGMSAFGYTGGYHVPLTTLTGSVRSDIVHIEELIAVGELAISDHRSSQPTFDEIVRIASEAHVAGLMTGKAGLVHFHVGDGDRGLELIRRAIKETELPARVFFPTHVNRRTALFEEACQLSAQGCTIDITAFPVEDRAGGHGAGGHSAEAALIRYLEGGYPPDHVTISSDGGGCLPVFDASGQIAGLDYAKSSALPLTLGRLLESGAPLERVLPAFTSNVASILRLHQKGTIAEGMDADLIILDDNNRPESVMARGLWHVRNHKSIIKGTFE